MDAVGSGDKRGADDVDLVSQAARAPTRNETPNPSNLGGAVGRTVVMALCTLWLYLPCPDHAMPRSGALARPHRGGTRKHSEDVSSRSLLDALPPRRGSQLVLWTGRRRLRWPGSTSSGHVSASMRTPTVRRNQRPAPVQGLSPEVHVACLSFKGSKGNNNNNNRCQAKKDAIPVGISETRMHGSVRLALI